jgi:hypothetical protein
VDAEPLRRRLEVDGLPGHTAIVRRSASKLC